MTAVEPMSTPDSGELREALGLAEHEVALRDLWRDLAEKNIEMGTDWPLIARTLYRDIDRLLAAHPEPVPTPDSANDATVGEREACICGESHCRRCGLSAGAAKAGVLCDPPHAGSHDFATPPAVDANRAPVSGGLDEGEREALLRAWPWPSEAATTEGGFNAVEAAVERILAARDSKHRAAPFRCQTHMCGSCGGCKAAKVTDLLAERTAERDTARREAGERIAQAIEGERSRRWQKHLIDHPYSNGSSCPYDYGEHDAMRAAALIARADALTSDDGSGA